MRASKGTTDPSAASTESEPATSAGAEQVFDREHVVERERRRCLRAVEKRQAFLRLQRHGLETRDAQAVHRARTFTANRDLADAEQHRRHVRERREIAGCADRALHRDDRQHIGVEQRDERVDHFAADAGMTAPEARKLQRHQQTNDRSRHRLAHADRMRQHEIALQQFELVGGNVRAREPSEARVDAIGGLALGGDVGDGLGARVDRGEARRVEFQRVGTACDLAQLRQGQKSGCQLDHGSSCLYKSAPSLNGSYLINKRVLGNLLRTDVLSCLYRFRDLNQFGV